MTALQAAKRRLAPAPGPRRLPAGIGRGLVLNVDFADHTRLYLGLYELELNRHLRRLCPPGTTSFDVGGSFGYDALVLAKLTAAAVVTFEADSAAAARLRANLALNPAEDTNIELIEGFVGDRDAQIRLDDIAAQRFVPGFLKVDVDGAELDVLRGAERLLHEHGPAVVLETHAEELEESCGALLASAGYRITVVHQRRVLRDHRPIPHNRWLVGERP
jgi:tRNA G37 N-methylase Trm5